MHVVVFVFLVCLFPPGFAAAQSGFYRYVDENGQVRYTDNSANVPSDQLKDMPLVSPGLHTSPKANIQQTVPSGPQRIVVNYDAKGGMILVNAILERHYPVVFHLDTGATNTMITEDDAQILNLPIKSANLVRGIIADGSIVEMPLVNLASIGLGEAVVENLEVTVGKMRLLGMDFLENFEMHINSQVGQLVLVKKESSSASNKLHREVESDAVRQDRENAKRDINSQISQLEIGIKTYFDLIEEYQGDIAELEVEREDAESALSATRKQQRFQGSGVSRDRYNEASASRIEKNIEEIDSIIQNRLDLIKLNEEKISGMKNKIKHLRTLRGRIK